RKRSTWPAPRQDSRLSVTPCRSTPLPTSSSIMGTPSPANAGHSRLLMEVLTRDISRAREAHGSGRWARASCSWMEERRPLSVPCVAAAREPMQRLDLRCLGLPEFRLNGRPVELALRKAVGLVVFL